MEARNPRVGYANAGYHLALHARELVEGDVDDDQLDLFDRVVADGDEAGLLGSLLSNLPRCMTLVPSRRRRSFMRGVMSAVEEGRL